MTSNHKLTTLIKGRKITSTSNAAGVLTIGFDDGSAMTVNTSGSANVASSGTVDKVQQADTTLVLVMEGGESLTIPLAEETSSVMVRDKGHGMEYAD
jgi:hypothetical protein